MHAKRFWVVLSFFSPPNETKIKCNLKQTYSRKPWLLLLNALLCVVFTKIWYTCSVKQFQFLRHVFPIQQNNLKYTILNNQILEVLIILFEHVISVERKGSCKKCRTFVTASHEFACFSNVTKLSCPLLNVSGQKVLFWVLALNFFFCKYIGLYICQL